MRRFSVVAAVGMLGLAAMTYAAPGKTPEAWASGRLNRFDPSTKLVVVTQGTHEMSFALDPGAQLMLGKKSLQPNDLTGDIGHDVRIRYTLRGSTKVADRIEVGSTGAAHATRAPKP